MFFRDAERSSSAENGPEKTRLSCSLADNVLHNQTSLATPRRAITSFSTNEENKMSTTGDRLGKQAMEVKKDLQEMGGTVRDTAQKKLEQVGAQASKYSEQGRDTAHGVACACEQFIRQRPLRSVLMASGIGWLLGRVWKRR
jgi:ElaB/YqjD/DUF883 family membrane-anchored ribosome-binding protein